MKNLTAICLLTVVVLSSHVASVAHAQEAERSGVVKGAVVCQGSQAKHAINTKGTGASNGRQVAPSVPASSCPGAGDCDGESLATGCADGGGSPPSGAAAKGRTYTGGRFALDVDGAASSASKTGHVTLMK